MFEEDSPYLDKDCIELIEKFITICLPVTITPCIDVKPIKTETCGKPIITPKHGNNCCKGSENGVCEFTIVQKMKVEIPIEFDAKTMIDDPFVDCEFHKENDECD